MTKQKQRKKEMMDIWCVCARCCTVKDEYFYACAQVRSYFMCTVQEESNGVYVSYSYAKHRKWFYYISKSGQRQSQKEQQQRKNEPALVAHFYDELPSNDREKWRRYEGKTVLVSVSVSVGLMLSSFFCHGLDANIELMLEAFTFALNWISNHCGPFYHVSFPSCSFFLFVFCIDLSFLVRHLCSSIRWLV